MGGVNQKQTVQNVQSGSLIYPIYNWIPAYDSIYCQWQCKSYLKTWKKSQISCIWNETVDSLGHIYFIYNTTMVNPFPDDKF